MGTEDDPDIYVGYYDDPDWISLVDNIDKRKGWKVQDGGIFGGSSATINLSNQNGRYTSGSSKIPFYSKVRIRADVRDAVDAVFQGRYQRYKGDMTSTRNVVKLYCTGAEFLLDCYEKTEDWAKNYPQYTYKEVIERCLAVPDSFAETGSGTGITLQTDGGDITSTHALDDMEQEKLSDIIREICERINYSGYMPDESTLILKSAGSDPSDPAVSLVSPFVNVVPQYNILKVKNYVMPWDGSEAFIPADERLTEKVVANYPDAWSGGDAGLTLEDSTDKVQRGQYGLKVSRTSGSGVPSVTLDCSKVGVGSYIDLTQDRFLKQNLAFWCYLHNFPVGGGYTSINIELEDTNGTKINIPVYQISVPWKGWIERYPNKWYDIKAPIGTDTLIHASHWQAYVYTGWWYLSGSDFNWKISKLKIWSESEITTGDHAVYIDALRFIGAKSIDPTLYTSLIKKDSGSITSYGHRTEPVSDSDLSSFDNAETLAEYNLDVLKTPIQKVEVKKGAKIWVKPSQTITLSVPEYEISGTHRVVEAINEWQNNVLRSTFKVVPQYDPVTRRTFKLDELAGLLSRGVS